MIYTPVTRQWLIGDQTNVTGKASRGAEERGKASWRRSSSKQRTMAAKAKCLRLLFLIRWDGIL